ncbi:hypothetical protein CDD80_496 [Ophiocordyceps camponoti-rufipedis]|uniref:3-isopropylmalate dehydrogenase n=1 Tax=Ophiocordyceps camponoti-rufipedis TaxID=2004952 RepID=A0A2C5YJP3_9HYPO|nr:hypothetical protein CDD80_496 [Ophiocordyceps camponoti-rufipedis]
MLTDHAFCHSDLMDPAHHDMSGLMGHSADLFGYPLSAPASASPNYWDPSMSMPMDLEFNAAVHGVMQPSSHRHTGSFDWNADITMFQDVSGPLPSASQESAQPPRQDRAIAPKPSGPEAASNPVALEDPFGIMNPGDSVDPGLLMGRPHTAAMDSAFGSVTPAHHRLVDRAASFGKPMAGELRRANSAQGPRSAALADRASVGSPVKSSAARPGLGRSCSENRGRRAGGRGMMHPTPLPSGLDAGLGHRRPAGRSTPPKTVPRVTSLASIPETSPQYRPRTSVRFTIDSRGRARAETTVVGDGLVSEKRRHRSRSAAWDSSDDDESTDDEPIIIPSRNSSFNASYALPDPCKPVGSIFHTSCRSLSDRSRSNSAESEAETVVNDKGGDALRELRKVVEDRQRRSRRMGSGRRPHGIVATNAASFPGGIISPTSLTESSQGNGVRCVCDDTSADEADGFMLQCESCEMWLHGRCINLTKRSMPRVYICRFCANTPNSARRCRGSGLGIAGLLSPLANKSYRTFRFPRKQTERDSTDGETGQVVAEGIKVLKTLEKHRPSVGKFDFQHHLLGGASIDKHGTALTDSALSAAKSADAVLLGAIGGPEWGTGAVRPEQGILRLRKELGTYGNLRPCFFASEGLVESSPLKPEVCRGTDIVIVRELTGGIYFGDRKEDDGDGKAWDMEPYARAEVERIARLAGCLARGRGDKVVWSLDKANVLATSRLWRRVVTEVFAAEFPDLRVEHQLIDSAAMLLVKKPTQLNGVVVTSNLFGDIVSDQVSAIPGSIGLLPSASIGGIPDGVKGCNGIYEPIHGNSPPFHPF